GQAMPGPPARRMPADGLGEQRTVAELPGRQAAAADGAASPAIETHDLAKRYGDTVALAGLTMTVPRGEVFGFLGPNGAGKTTAVKLLLGLARATGGRGQVLGAPIGDLRARRRIGYLPELFRYQSWLRAREVLGAHSELAGLPAEGRSREIEAVLLLGGVERVCDRVAIVDRGRVIAEGPIDELLGARSLRVRATGLDDGDRSSFARFGPLTVDGDWLTIRPIEPEVVPEVVATIVA